MRKDRPEIYFDMDDVIYPLSKLVIEEHYNKDFNDNMNWRDNKKYWWGDANAPKSYFENLLLQPGVFNSIKPLKEDIEIIKQLHSEGYDINFATAPQWNSCCVMEKIEFLRENFSFVDIDNNLHFTRKKYKMANPNRILLDDNDDHLVPWDQHGGIAVAYQDLGFSKETKLRVFDMNEFYKFVHSL